MSSKKFVVFGTGRVGRNMSAYLRALGHDVLSISRAEAEEALAREDAVQASDAVLAAIPDGALERWAAHWRRRLPGKTLIHFSGALVIDGMKSYHPLYSFPRTELSFDTIRAVAIARQEGAPPFAQVVPGAANPEFVIADADRAYYHALAVLSGNFAAFVWNETAKGFAGRLGVAPADVMASYLAGVVDRFVESPFDSLTGPLARKDRASVEANLKALEGEPRLAALYRAFLDAAWPDYAADNP